MQLLICDSTKFWRIWIVCDYDNSNNKINHSSNFYNCIKFIFLKFWFHTKIQQETFFLFLHTSNSEPESKLNKKEFFKIPKEHSYSYATLYRKQINFTITHIVYIDCLKLLTALAHFFTDQENKRNNPNKEIFLKSRNYQNTNICSTLSEKYDTERRGGV